MSNANSQRPGPCADPVERTEHETRPQREVPPAVDLGYLPPSAQGFEKLTLEQWIDLCA